MSARQFDPIPQISNELNIPAKSTAAVVKLLNEGNTIPFIARYRKEATGNLDEVQIRSIQDSLSYLAELEDRRETILQSIESQGKLTGPLREQIMACSAKNALEDLYLPYKPKRRTRAMIAKEKGLEPLGLKMMEQPLTGSPQKDAEAFINPEMGVNDAEEALAGACDIAAELIAENAEVRAYVRQVFALEGIVVSRVVQGKDKEPTKYQQYYDFKESVAKIPSHRYLAIRRGEREGILNFQIEIEPESLFVEIGRMLKKNPGSPYAELMERAIQDSCKRLILPSVETDLRVDLKMNSDRAAVEIFAANLRNLLISAPLGERSVLGIDPGIRTGCKCAAVEETGKFLGTLTIYPSKGDRGQAEAAHDFLEFIAKHKPYAIAIGNGTAGRETEAFVRKLLEEAGLKDVIVVQVNEAGASVYSASDVAREEFPDLDITVRGAISIARRLQDPLAELVKVDPKAIGVGQYQHDVHQPLLQDKLHEVVESCVNQVGVEVNTASASLLSYVAGIGPSLAAKIVKHREMNGSFKGRKGLLEVSGFGPRTFEQAAGFLRVRGGIHPLDASAVHPERYALVEIIAKDMGAALTELMSNHALINRIDVKRYISESVGELTLQDIIAELKKPGRDPRATFEKPCFREDIHSISDLKAGMKLDGIVTNVAAFGAFVDLGVHQDGLIHVSELTDRYIKDPNEVVRVGDKIKVEVVSVDIERKRIALTARLGQGPKSAAKKQNSDKKQPYDRLQGQTSKKGGFLTSPFSSL